MKKPGRLSHLELQYPSQKHRIRKDFFNAVGDGFPLSLFISEKVGESSHAFIPKAPRNANRKPDMNIPPTTT
jgi:hypothetical protein